MKKLAVLLMFVVSLVVVSGCYALKQSNVESKINTKNIRNIKKKSGKTSKSESIKSESDKSESSETKSSETKSSETKSSETKSDDELDKDYPHAKIKMPDGNVLEVDVKTYYDKSGNVYIETSEGKTYFTSLVNVVLYGEKTE